MALDDEILAALARLFEPSAYLRCTPWIHRRTPLGMGFGRTRFASPGDRFKLLYAGKDLATSIAEAIIRDRFQGGGAREMMLSELSDWAVCEVSATAPLKLLDLRRDGCFRLGISTDIVGAKAQDEAREFSQLIYDTTDFEGILYHSRLRKRDCIAVYDRAAAKLTSGAAIRFETLEKLLPALRALKVKLIA